ncbi:fimbria/pilus outer membrane usher protein [Cedecea davisae]|uniref:fimbria/pilus outer membrane usher protein n=1 Tax=Cedecea davisae TaxID=158484 RepID=UPI001D0A6C05|nr:fimbria/pilus outer membrane usher protein [Cedecea davisae]
MNCNQPFRLSMLAAFVISVCAIMPGNAQAESNGTSNTDSADESSVNVTFDPIFLSPGAVKKADIKRFEKGAAALPGNYKAQVFVNDINLGNENITFIDDGKGNVNLCMTPAALRRINLNYKQLPAATVGQLEAKSDECLQVKKLLPELSVNYDSGAQRLNLTIPQAYLHNIDNGYVSPEYWDDGISALMLGYQGNYYTMTSHGERQDSAFVGLNAGLNLGAWQFRHNGNYSWMQKTGGSYRRVNTYVQRDLPAIGGRMIAGENNTSGNVFDSLPFRGVELRDEERMVPQSERGYAPEVRGIARTNAKVTVRQNGQIIRETTVAPGAFDIDDLYPNGYGGDLDVTVTEADGSVQHFSVPYASVAQLLRPGSHHFDVVIGQYNDTRATKHRQLYQITYQRGLTNTFTGYGGLQSSNDDYYSVLMGTGINTPFGALALDASQARTHFNGQGSDNSSISGQSYRITYSKFVPETKSNFSIAAYRYSTSGYLDYSTAMQMQNEVENGRSPKNIYHAKNRFTTTLNQGLPDGYGQLYVTGYAQDYWNKETGSDLQYQLGYNNSIKSVSFGLNAGRTRNGSGKMETTFMLNMSMPLGGTGTSNTPNLTAALSRDTSGNYGQQVGLSGTAGQEHQFSYGATASHYGNGAGTSGSLNGQYRSQYSNLSGSIGKGKSYSSASAGASGTLIAWSEGVVATPYSSNTFAVIDADGASGASVGNYTGVKVDHFGHAAVPYLNPYEMNEVALDPKGIPQTIELENTSQRVAPHEGSVVKIKFATRRGFPLLLTLNKSQAGIPFGAEVTDTRGNNVGIVGQGGAIYARVEAESDILHVRWGTDADSQCNVRYALSKEQMKSNALIQMAATCTFNK